MNLLETHKLRSLILVRQLTLVQLTLVQLILVQLTPVQLIPVQANACRNLQLSSNARKEYAVKISYLARLIIASVLTVGLVACSNSNELSSADSTPKAGQVDPCAGVNPCAGLAAISIFAEDGVAIRGADPVAYFTQGEAVIGSAEFEHEWNGATWQFASAEHRDLFASNPEEYAPQYGGYCAWAVSQGATASVEPEAWRIVDGKLYLNFDKRVQQRWEQDIEGNIALADENWPGVLTQ